MTDQEREIIFKLGTGNNYDEAGSLFNVSGDQTAARTALESVWQYWKHTLGAVQVETPDPSLNIIDKRMAHISNFSMPHLGEKRILPIRRSFWFS